MKYIKSTVSYAVPHWNFCNEDNLNKYGELTAKTCQFCVKEKGKYRCMLYNEELHKSGDLIEKTKSCCRATAGFKSEVVVEHLETTKYIMPPKELIKQAIDDYNSKLNELLAQRYPRQIAEMAARKFTLGE